jgi:serine/threonine protein kinase
MPSSANGSFLPPEDWNELGKIADQFAAVRKLGPVDDWLPYVPPRDDRKHRPVLMELVRIDMEMTWQSRQHVRVEDYVARFPGLDPLPVELIVEEFRLRRQHGDQPGLEEYRARFPDSFAEIERRIRELPAASQPASSIAQTQRNADVPAAPAAAAGPVFPEGYQPIARIGGGNFGEVWKAEAPGGVEVAIKIISQPLDHDAAKRELQALELVKKIQYPTLLATYAYWVIQNRLVIAMELADGSLRDRLKECKQKGLMGIPPDELLIYFRDAAAGLDYLHWQKVLHRDVKPENILLKKGYAKVCDFGLARVQTSAMMSTSFAGTPAFMAPEMWGGKINERSDQYSLAFTYAELRLGRRPLEGDDFYAVMVNSQQSEPDLGELPAGEKTVLRRALSKRPEERYDSCQDFVDAVERALVPDGPAPKRRPSPIQRLMPGSETGTSKTERSILAEEPVKKPASSVETTFAGESANDTPKQAPAVWKPQRPSAKPALAPRAILLAIIGVLGISATSFLVWYFAHDPNRLPATSSASHADRPTPPDTKQKRTENGNSPIEQPKADWLPVGFAEANDKLVPFDGKKYAEKIVRKPERGPERVTMTLLKQEQPGEPAGAFYMMDEKVWNALFREFRQDRPGATAWRDHGGAKLPAVNVTWEEAKDFAKWLSGELPTPDQCDLAAGFWRRSGRAGPARNDGGLGIAVNTLLPVGDSADVSPAGIRDTASNGREFTREPLAGSEGRLVILRGRMFTLSKPLTYADLEVERSDLTRTQAQFRDKPSPYTGFRVVIPIR